MRPELQLALEAARNLPTSELPRLLGDLREIETTALARLTASAARQDQADELVDVAEAARRLGVGPSWLYHHHCKLPFAQRVGRKLVFSAMGIEKYIRARR